MGHVLHPHRFRQNFDLQRARSRRTTIENQSLDFRGIFAGSHSLCQCTVPNLLPRARRSLTTPRPRLSYGTVSLQTSVPRGAHAPSTKCARISEVCPWPEASCPHMCAKSEGISAHRVPLMLDICCAGRAQVIAKPVHMQTFCKYKQVKVKQFSFLRG